MEVLFKTVHGSRLYGLNTETSDEDYYTVVAKKPYTGRGQGKARYAKQNIVGNEDSMVVDFGTWVEMCKAGVPQALEAMFSQMPIVDNIQEFRRSFYCGSAVYEKYLSTIKSFALAEDKTIKKRRHALRLGLNLNEIGRYGRFNPTLSQEDRDYINAQAHKSHGDVYGLAVCLGWDV